jgi:hypothetical protein
MSKLYSSNLAPELSRVVKAIRAQSVDEFRSRKFEKPETSTSYWREAYYMPETGLWSVEERSISPGTFTNINGEESFSTEREESKTILSNVCFFDALHSVALFEKAEIGLNRSLLEIDIKDLGQEHFHNFALEQGIPFDIDSLPVPAARGRPLLQGKFAPGAYEVAKKTKGIELKVLENTDAIAKISSNAFKIPEFGQEPAGSLGVEGKIGRIQEKNELIKYSEHSLSQVDQSIDKIRTLKDTFNSNANKKFELVHVKNYNRQKFISGKGPGANVLSGTIFGGTSGLMTLLFTGIGTNSFLTATIAGLSVGLPVFMLPILCYLAPKTSFPGLKLNRMIKKLRSDAHRSDGELKSAMLSLADNLELGIKALKARNAFKEIKSGSWLEMKRANRLLKQFNSVARSQKRDAGTIENMQHAILNDLNSNDFENEIRKMIEEGAKAIVKAYEAQKSEIKEQTKQKQKQLEYRP